MLRSLLLLAVCASATSRPYYDWRGEEPGRKHLIKPEDMPPPYATDSSDNVPRHARRPAGALPKAPAGWTVSLFSNGLDEPRLLRVAPNGDVFVAESRSGRVRVLRPGKDGTLATTAVFASGLKKPFGIAFHPPGKDPTHVYVAETDRVVRFAYSRGQLAAKGKPERVVDLPGGGLLRGGGHWTRDVAFSTDGRTMWVSVGSRSNVNDPDEDKSEERRACVLASSPDGMGLRVFASGLRNPVGLAVHPVSGELWASVNERDGLGDDLPPEYVTRVKEEGFYGWPWFYIGGRPDPRHAGKKPGLKDKVIMPDVLLQPHTAPLQLTFHDGDLFVALHGSWNRKNRTGYAVIRVPMKGSRAAGGYEDFLTGFVLPDGKVWGRPVGVATAADGALLVSDDESGSIWRVARAKR